MATKKTEKQNKEPAIGTVEHITEWNGDIIDRRMEGVLLFDVREGVYTKDPGTNSSRVDEETGQLLGTPMCLKRKIRNYGQHTDEQVLVKAGVVLQEEHKKALATAKKNKDDVRGVLCKKYLDTRWFGHVITGLGRAGGSVWGALQVTTQRSVEAAYSLEMPITRICPARKNKSEVEGEEGAGTGQFGNMPDNPYALYRSEIFVSPTRARQRENGYFGTGTTWQDLAKFFKALQLMFELDRAADRGVMTTRRVIMFEHPNMIGISKADHNFNRVTVERVAETKEKQFASSYKDYRVAVDTKGLGKVQCWEYDLDKDEDGNGEVIRTRLG